MIEIVFLFKYKTVTGEEQIAMILTQQGLH